jgi:hypothetical protein
MPGLFFTTDDRQDTTFKKSAAYLIVGGDDLFRLLVLYVCITRWVVRLASHDVLDQPATPREQWESMKTTKFVPRESGYEQEVKSEVRVSARCGFEAKHGRSAIFL